MNANWSKKAAKSVKSVVFKHTSCYYYEEIGHNYDVQHFSKEETHD